jgi:hypothetical protein
MKRKKKEGVNMKRRVAKKLLFGTMLALSSSILLPIVRRKLRSVWENKERTDDDRNRPSLLQKTREEIVGIVAEAQFERMRKKLDQDIMGGH